MAKRKKTPKRAGRKPRGKQKLSFVLRITPSTRLWLEEWREYAAVKVSEGIENQSAAPFCLADRRNMKLGLVLDELLAGFVDQNPDFPPYV